MFDPRNLLCLVLLTGFAWAGNSRSVCSQDKDDHSKTIRVGIIGLDTSHAIAFTKLLNDPDAKPPLSGCRVTCAFPKGSPDIESSVSRVPKYTQQIQEMGVEIVDSIDELIELVDAVLLETNDGRPHLQQVLPVLKARIPTFIDKPVAGSLVDAIAIFEAADRLGTPVFSSSSLRFAKPALLARQGKLVGEVLGCETYSPATIEPTHPDLFWYGIHGVEQLFTVMGTGCQSVSRTSTDTTDVVVGLWQEGRIGTFRGTRTGPHKYGGTVFGTEGQESTGGNEGYASLVTEIARFFQTGKPPVAADETIEIYAFMKAADESKRLDGKRVLLQEVIDSAQTQADQKLAELNIHPAKNVDEP